MRDPQFNFSNLTPDVVFNAIASLGIHPESGLLALNSYENRVYQFLDENKKRYVAKFYRPMRWNEIQIREEHAFTQELADADIGVAPPLAFEGDTLSEFNGYLFALFPSKGGRTFEVDNWQQLEQVGTTLGRIHQIGRQQLFQHRPTIELEEYIFQPRRQLEQCSFIPSGLETTFFADLDRVIHEVVDRWHRDWTPIRLHGDCHPSNILWSEEPIFVDLDDARNGPAIQDIWLLLHGNRNEQLAQLDTLIESYESFCDFPHQELQLIESFRSLRMVHYMGWLAKRWQDPAFPNAFPWFAEAKYWENQILSFKEQIAALESPTLSSSPQW